MSRTIWLNWTYLQSNIRLKLECYSENIKQSNALARHQKVIEPQAAWLSGSAPGAWRCWRNWRRYWCCASQSGVAIVVAVGVKSLPVLGANKTINFSRLEANQVGANSRYPHRKISLNWASNSWFCCCNRSVFFGRIANFDLSRCLSPLSFLSQHGYSIWIMIIIIIFIRQNLFAWYNIGIDVVVS